MKHYTRKVRKALAKLAQQIIEALERSEAEVSRQQPETDSSPPASSNTFINTDSEKRSIVKNNAIVTRAGYSSPPTLMVDQHRKVDYATITEALKAAEPGTRILVWPGLYREGIVIDKHVEILGYGERSEIVIESFSRTAVVFVANMGKIANLTIRQVGSDAWYGVDISQGGLELEECDISSQGKACVAILHSAYPYLRRNRIHDGSCVGIFVCKMGQGSIEDNDIFNNQSAGVAITAGGKPTLRRNRITQNGDVGVQVYSGGGIFEDNDLSGNAKGAWRIAPDCEANVQRRGNKRPLA